MGREPVGTGLPHPEADSRAANLSGLWGPAHLVGGELWGSAAAERADPSQPACPPLRSDARFGILTRGGAGGFARGAGAQVRGPGGHRHSGRDALR